MELDHLEYGNRKSDTGVLMCHGFGANMGDLADLGPCLDPQGRFAWYFPQAPYSMPFPGHAWFPESKHDMDRALQGSYFQDLARMDDPGRTRSLELLKSFCTRHPHQKWILGGFSQGSMMALHLAASAGFTVAGVLLFSSAPFAMASLEKELDHNYQDRKPGFPVFMSHGLQDPLLVIQGARQLRSFLEARKMTVESHEFRGGHEIPGSVLAACAGFLGEI